MRIGDTGNYLASQHSLLFAFSKVDLSRICR
jgi:hypothetical protein